MGKHSNDKPVEPEKRQEVFVEIPKAVERKPIVESVERPSFESRCTKLDPIINPSFKQQMDNLDLNKKSNASSDGSISVGTSCKRGGCTTTYDSPSSDNATCVYHPGVPIFHEGYKFWSCCQKKTSDFSEFLAQVGCESGKHKWIKDESTNVACRWDWHQTPTNIVVAIYAKNYDYSKSFVKVNSVRLAVKLVFPLQENAEFNIDLELRGVIDISKATVHMYGTKVEITMPKADGGQWVKLDFPRDVPKEVDIKSEPVAVPSTPKIEAQEVGDDSDVDLDDLEIVAGAKIMELGELARSCQLVEES